MPEPKKPDKRPNEMPAVRDGKKEKMLICPNCGRKLTSLEFLPNAEKLPQDLLGMSVIFSPISNRFLCPDCNYSGLPIEIDARDYNELKFKNEEIKPPLERANPQWFKPLAYLALLTFAFYFVSLLGIRMEALIPLLIAVQLILVLYLAYLFLKKTSIYKKMS